MIERILRAQRAFTTAGLVIAGTIAPLAMAAPASATAQQCIAVLNHYGYEVGPKASEACGWPHKVIWGQNVPDAKCISGLTALRVKGSHADKACKFA